MNNKQQVNKLKDYAELAWASYGYFHLIGKKFDDKRNKTKENRIIVLADILDYTYKGYVTSDHTTLINPEELKGDFSPTQAKRFFERYELIHHIPNTTISGFSATIFRDLGELDTATNARKLENDFSYVIAFRDTESTREIA